MIKIYAVTMSGSVSLSLDIFPDKSNEPFTPTLNSKVLIIVSLFYHGDSG